MKRRAKNLPLSIISGASRNSARNSNHCSCYVITTDVRVEFRVDFSVGETAEKILTVSDLDDSCGKRLLIGE
jgi:hypothetical protein